ncbi:hypothetical protein SDC9_187822 [bioreactor metagenome]|uniref:Uncharacterized protein n=1 Tax=bioreactor metagenome TaxID=1076179 RepID=A0A645HNY4_9ZZZZ
MGPLGIVFLPPVFDDLTGMAHRHEPVLVQTFIPELTVEAFDVSILLWFAWLNEAQAQSLAICPFIEHLAGEFRAVIDGD